LDIFKITDDCDLVTSEIMKAYEKGELELPMEGKAAPGGGM
jgi:hypothetical protein